METEVKSTRSMQIGHPNFLHGCYILCFNLMNNMNDLSSRNAKCFVLWHFVSDVWSPQSAFIGFLTNYSCSCLGIQHGDQVSGMLISSRSSDSIITIIYMVLFCDHQCDDVLIVGWEQFPFPCLPSPVLHSSPLFFPCFSSYSIFSYTFYLFLHLFTPPPFPPHNLIPSFLHPSSTSTLTPL